MPHYLFVHFRETTTPDGEQVYFGLSRDGFHWEALNEGQPVLWAYYGDRGVRDMTVTRDRATGLFHIFATDLSLSYGMRGKYAHSWNEISRNGSKCLAHWQSDDLVHWSEEELVPMGEDFGCVWAPDIIFDEDEGDYLLHWSSSHRADDYRGKAIWYSRTRDFIRFSKPEMLYGVPGVHVIDSAMYRENGKYYLFVKREKQPAQVVELVSDRITGPFQPVPGFDESLSGLEAGRFTFEGFLSVNRPAPGGWALVPVPGFLRRPGRGPGLYPLCGGELGERPVRPQRRGIHFPLSLQARHRAAHHGRGIPPHEGPRLEGRARPKIEARCLQREKPTNGGNTE